MSDLIEALTIFMKYGNPRNPTNCEHDVLWVDINPTLVSREDDERLKELGFMFDAPGDGGGYHSFRFGSC